MKKLTLLLAALFTLATSVRAQDNAAKLSLAREVITAMHADRMVEGMMAQMKKMQASAIPPDATPEQRAQAEKMQAEIAELSTGAAKKMVSQMDQVYADVYSDTELKAMKTFFISPEGQSMLAKQPQIVQRIMPLMQQMQQELGPKIQALSSAAKNQPAPALTPPAP
ncbi:MAG: DUF2059 domain-containing protein [Opitutus sp.]